MTPEAASYLAKAEGALIKARKVLQIDLHDDAGRHAYYVAFHAAQALIFERAGKASKAHSGVKAQYSRLAKNEAGFLSEHSAFLARA